MTNFDFQQFYPFGPNSLSHISHFLSDFGTKCNALLVSGENFWKRSFLLIAQLCLGVRSIEHADVCNFRESRFKHTPKVGVYCEKFKTGKLAKFFCGLPYILELCHLIFSDISSLKFFTVKAGYN